MLKAYPIRISDKKKGEIKDSAIKHTGGNASEEARQLIDLGLKERQRQEKALK